MNASLEPPRRGLTGAIVPALTAAALAGLGALFIVGNQGSEPGLNRLALPPGCIVEGLDAIGGPIALRDVNGQVVTDADFSGGPSVIYFGFTHCPDVCPTSLYALGEATRLPGGRDLQAIMISIDPERDTPDLMRAYVGSEGFPEGMVGLTGSAEAVRAAAEEFGVYYAKSESADDPENYNMDHTSFLYVMDENWRARAQMLSVGATPEAIAACISAGLG
jgi:protein SCO1/2